jgi:hypothetical protein
LFAFTCTDQTREKIPSPGTEITTATTT